MTAFFSPDVRSLATAVPPELFGRLLSVRSDADDQQPAERTILLDELFRDRRGIAFEALAVERRADPLLRRAERPEAGPVLAATGSTSA